MVHQSHCIPQSLHHLSTFSDSTITASTPITSSYPVMSSQEIMDVITPIILYLQYCAANRTLPTLILMLPYDTGASLFRMGSVLNNSQALKAHPIAILTPYIKATNTIFHQILPLLSFEPSLAARLQQGLMTNLLQSL